MACEDSALDTLKQTNSMERYNAEMDKCKAPQSGGGAATATAEAPNPSASSSVNAEIIGGKEPVKDKNWWVHTAVLIIALVLVYHYAKKLWNKSPIMKVGIVVVGAIFLHDAMHHFWNKGFVYSVRAKLNV